MFSIKIKVKQFELKNSGIMINKEEKKSYLLQKTIPMEINKTKIFFYSNKTFVLLFNSEDEKRDFLEQIGLKKVS